jgi:hypothetical protein
MSIGHYEFRILEKQEQVHALLNHGILLHETITENTIVRLYSMHTFYVAITVDFESHELVTIRTFVNPEIVDEYLAGIKIDDL